MKKINCFLITILLVLSCSENSTIVGKWTTYGNETNTKTPIEAQTVVTYKDNGTYEEISLVSLFGAKVEMRFYGTYRLEGDKLITKQMQSVIDGKAKVEEKPEEKSTIITLNSKELVYKEEHAKHNMRFSRIE